MARGLHNDPRMRLDTYPHTISVHTYAGDHSVYNAVCTTLMLILPLRSSSVIGPFGSERRGTRGSAGWRR